VQRTRAAVLGVELHPAVVEVAANLTVRKRRASGASAAAQTCGLASVGSDSSSDFVPLG